jgi:signal transduction histidine kinase
VLASPVIAQGVDSLMNLLKNNDLTPAKRMETINILNGIFVHSNPKQLFKHAQEGLQIAETEKDRQYISIFNEQMGNYYAMRKNFDTATIFYDKAMKIAVGIGDRKQECSVLISYANLNKSFSNDEKALEYFLKALKIAEEIDNKRAMVTVMTSIADIYRTLYNDDKVLEYSRRALQIAEAENFTNLKITPTIYLSYIYRDHKEYPEALEYAQKAYELNKISYNSATALTVNQMLVLLYWETDKADSALVHAQECLAIAKRVGAPQYLLLGWNAMSNAYRAKKMFRESADAAQHAWEADSTNLYISTNIFCNLLHANIVLGNMKEAERYFLVYDSIFQKYMDKQIHESVAEQEVKYETVKKEKLIDDLQNERKNLHLLLVIGGISLLLAIAVITAIAMVSRQKRRLLVKEKQLAASEAALQSEMSERARIGRDLHDRLGGMLSAAKLSLGGAFQDSATCSILDSSIDELRRIAYELMPEMLLRFGLKQSLESFCAPMPNVHFRHFGDDIRYDEKTEASTYFCTMELVNNAIHHSDAKNIDVQLVQHPDGLSVTVQDDGKGFDIKTCKKGLGLNNFRTRIQSLNGITDISSEPGNGAVISFELKIANVPPQENKDDFVK